MACRRKPLNDFFDYADPGVECCAGIDEAGRGCLAGPVVAAAVVLPQKFSLRGLTDSKLLTSAAREKLAVAIRNMAISWGIGAASPKTIDKINILQATLLAMARACSKLAVVPRLLLIDGNTPIPASCFSPKKFSHQNLPPQKTIVGGDRTELAISAASILAKTWRDSLMLRYHEIWPQYDFARHKGYGTKRHMEALREFGPTPIHRMTFHGVRIEPESGQKYLYLTSETEFAAGGD